MKARSTCSCTGSARNVSTAGARRSSIRSSRPARAQYLRAIAVNSSDTSQHSRRPSVPMPRAIAIEDRPVKVPTSTAYRAPVILAIMVRNPACSGAICITIHLGSAARVSPIRSATSASGAEPCATTYACSSSGSPAILFVIAPKLAGRPQVGEPDPEFAEQPAQQRQGQAHHVPVIALDGFDERAAQPLDGERAGDLQRLAGTHVRRDLRVGHVGEVDRGTPDGFGALAVGVAIEVDQAVAGVQDA